jgi:hypothetical protein
VKCVNALDESPFSQPMFALSQRPLSRLGRRIRWGFLGLATAPILGAYVYNQGYRVPMLGCPILHLTGIPCPTCGMTRSFMAIVRGEFSQAIGYHLLGPVIFIACLAAALHVGLELWQQQKIISPLSQLVSRQAFQLIVLLIVLSYYAYRLYLLADAGVLYPSLMRSPLGHVLTSFL